MKNEALSDKGLEKETRSGLEGVKVGVLRIARHFKLLLYVRICNYNHIIS